MAVYIPFGSNRSSNRWYPWWGNWKISGPQSYPVTTKRIGSRWTHQNVYVRVTSSQIENLDRDDRITSLACILSWTRSGQSCSNVSDRIRRRDQIVSSAIEISRSYRIQAQQIVSERIDPHYFVLNFREIQRWATNERIARQWEHRITGSLIGQVFSKKENCKNILMSIQYEWPWLKDRRPTLT